jgi:hypothetical protein
MTIQGVGTGGASSLQFLQAQQAFRPRSAKEEQPNAPEMAPGYPALEEPFVEVSAAKKATSIAPTGPSLPFADIQSVARQAGFVGLSERDIQRAYVLGESLLADYRV